MTPAAILPIEGHAPERLREQLAALFAKRRDLNAQIDLLDKETRSLRMVQSRQDHPCGCVRLNGEIGVNTMRDAETHRRTTFGLGFVSELLSADINCAMCEGSGVPTAVQP